MTSSILKPSASLVSPSRPPNSVCFLHDQNSDLPSVPVRSSGDFSGLVVPVSCHSVPFSAFFDSGAAINIVKLDIFRSLSSFCDDLNVLPPDVNLRGFSGKLVMPHGKVYLSLSLSSSLPVISDFFYVVPDTQFNADFLIGLPTMRHFDISLFPALNEISMGSVSIPSVSSLPPPPPSAGAALPDASILPIQHLSLPARDNVDIPRPSEPLSCHSEPPLPSSHNLLLAEPVSLSAFEFRVVSAKIASAVPGSDVLCFAQTSNCHDLVLDSVLTTVADNGLCQIALRNVSSTPVKFKSGVLLGDVTVCSQKLNVLEELPCLHIQQASPVSDSVTPPIVQDHLSQLDFCDSLPDLLALLNDYRSVVSLPGETLGFTDVIKHSIQLTPGAAPNFIPSYRIPHSRRVLLDDAVQEMLATDIIEPSCSPHNAPLLLVPKKTGDWRVVVDFRALNANTIPDCFPIPRLHDILQSLGDSNSVFSTIDLQSGFFQVELDAASRPYTAFTTGFGQFMFKRMAQGLRNSPLTFQRLMNSVLSGLLGKHVFCFQDDVIIASKSVPEHFKILSQVLFRFQEAGLKLKLSKSSFLKKQVTFLGHKIDKDGIHTLDGKVSAVKAFPVPTDVDKIRSFVGLAGFYRQFIQNFSLIAQPLTHLLKKDVPFVWSTEQQSAFDTLKSALTSSPVLAFPNFEKEFILCTDASGYGVGAVLMQLDHSGKHRAIAYASRLLNKAEQNYDVTNRESLAVVWALRHFREIILGYPIRVQTDHYAVTEIFKGKNYTGKFARWQLTVQDFNPTISYIPGKLNTVADSLSRCIAPVSTLTSSPVLPTLAEFTAHQSSDAFCSRIKYFLDSGDDSNLPKLSVTPDSFFLQDDVLYKSAEISSEYVRERLSHILVVPQSLVPTILYHVHDSDLAGHPGRDRCLAQARRSYFWLTMRKDIFHHCSLCPQCASHRPSPALESKSLPYPIASKPWESVSIDLLKLPITENGFQYLFVCVDSFSRFSVLTPLKDKTANSVARAFVNYVICPYGSPSVLLSDNGSEFNNTVLLEICKSFQIKKCNIVPHSPCSNGKVERCNKRILDVLRYMTHARHSWDEWLPRIACSINTAIHSTINESPHFVLFGTDQRLPYEFLHTAPLPVYDFDDYVKCCLTDFQSIHQSIHDRLSASQTDMLRKQHVRAKDPAIEVGDMAFSRVHDRNSKLDPKFSGPLRVIESLHGHKFKVLDLRSLAERVVHADHLKRVSRGFDEDDISLVPRQPVSDIPPLSSKLTPHTHSSYRQKLRSFNPL